MNFEKCKTCGMYPRESCDGYGLIEARIEGKEPWDWPAAVACPHWKWSRDNARWPVPMAFAKAGYTPPPGPDGKRWADGVQKIRLGLADGVSVTVWGDYGTGKSTAAAAVVNEIREGKPARGDKPMKPGRFAVFIAAQDFLDRLKASFDSDNPEDSETAIIDDLQSCHLLVVDDIDAARETEWASDRLRIVLKGRYDAGLRTIITLNHNPARYAKDPLWGSVMDRHRGEVVHFAGASMRFSGRGARAPQAKAALDSLPAFAVRPGESTGDAVKREHREQFAQEAGVGANA